MESRARELERTFSPGTAFAAAALIKPRPTSRELSPAKSAAAKAKPPASEPAFVTTVFVVQDGPKSPWRTAVASERDLAGRDGAKITSIRPQDASARYDLVVHIQRELKRVGCYAGAIDGSWSAGSKRAVDAFVDRVNAALPTAEPDYILLSLINAHRSATCGPSCPKGQSLAGDGRCMPAVILAQAAKKVLAAGDRGQPVDPAAAKTATEPQLAWGPEIALRPRAIASAASTAPLPGRMSIGGPRPDALEGPMSAGAMPSDLRVTPAAQVGRKPVSLALAESEPGLPATDPVDGTALPAREFQYGLEPDGAHASISGGLPAADERANRAPEEHVNRPRAQRTSQLRSNGQGTRSVQHLFTHPLGHM
jgi:hypothetical protein